MSAAHFSLSKARRFFRIVLFPFKWIGIGLFIIAFLMFSGNVVFHSQRGVPYRALDPDAAPCKTPGEATWDVLARSANGQVTNDEWSAIDKNGGEWQAKFACTIQHHALPGYKAADGSIRSLSYDLAFLEFQENGKPYALRTMCDKAEKNCDDEGYGAVKKINKSQLTTIVDHLDNTVPRYVMVFVHGWRHDASIGDSNVSEFREYAAHAARFLEDRWTDPAASKPHVTAVFVGWRGARTDETWLRRHLGTFGAWIGNFSAILTLFDRKPVSEAIAPSVLAGLRALEEKLDIAGPLPAGSDIPAGHANKMIVFGHSLGGNLLATALQDELLKKVAHHPSGTYMLPVLGDLVILINPASEATKWTSIQRGVWSRIALSAYERQPFVEYAASHSFFRRDQRPILISVTAARDWPPGGRRELDCFAAADEKQQNESRRAATEGFNYDYATYDMFPAFKFDLRPVADTMRRIALGVDPHDDCDQTPVSTPRHILASPLVGLSALLRVLPFMQTEPEQTHTIGHLDPPRAPRGGLNTHYFTGHPFGTTHELRGVDPDASRVVRKISVSSASPREIPLTYDEVISSAGACPIARSWLLDARNETERRDREKGVNNHATGWDSAYSAANAPGLEFRHGFHQAGIAPITRANDPFWNVRAFDSALARHDGYMLSSFICAMNQLVMDDIIAPAP
jgi:hypothetical protein